MGLCRASQGRQREASQTRANDRGRNHQRSRFSGDAGSGWNRRCWRMLASTWARWPRWKSPRLPMSPTLRRLQTCWKHSPEHPRRRRSGKRPQTSPAWTGFIGSLRRSNPRPAPNALPMPATCSPRASAGFVALTPRAITAKLSERLRLPSRACCLRSAERGLATATAPSPQAMPAGGIDATKGRCSTFFLGSSASLSSSLCR